MKKEKRVGSWIILIVTILISLPLLLLNLNEVFKFIILSPETIRATSELISFSIIGSILGGAVCLINGIKLLKTENKKLAISSIIIGIIVLFSGGSIFLGKMTNI